MRKLDTLDDGVVALDDPSAFALGVLAGGVDVRSSAHAADGEAMRAPGRHVTCVLTRVDEDGVAVARGRGGLAGLGHRAVRAHQKRRTERRRRGEVRTQQKNATGGRVGSAGPEPGHLTHDARIPPVRSSTPDVPSPATAKS